MTALERPAALTEVMGADPLADETGTSLWQGAFQRLRRDPGAIIDVHGVRDSLGIARGAPAEL